MGLSVAKQLAKKGANLAIVARDQKKLEAAVDSITVRLHVRTEDLANEAPQQSALKPRSQKIHSFSADLRDAQECTRVIKEISSWNNDSPPDIVWCCAGQSLPSLFIEAPPEQLKGQMDTVYWSAAFTAQAALRTWLTPSPASQTSKSELPRHLIFTCSTLAFVPIVGYGTYSPAKAAMRSLSETLMQEIQLYNGARKNRSIPAPPVDVKIHTIFPMGILSPGFDHEESVKPDVTKKLEAADKPQTPEEVASASIKGLERGETMITTMFLGAAMKGTALGGSPRNNIVLDTMMSWLSGIIILFVGPDLASQTWKWGKEKGVRGRSDAPS
jgi:3-dehydrosphinganine reductase